ncbi:FAD-dependent oxidoreductase [Deinococcus sp.]|uniref:FAD-dependent oxidoreductase n=1 Tax=Deinococcus sp. TaxID=47478 RepID=UPI0025C510F5|nr:FAD-dependent oxidoreductase [Deinococcus sp.]
MTPASQPPASQPPVSAQPASEQPAPGQVWAHVGQPFTPPAARPDGTHYDFIVIGAGRMGSLLTLALTRAAPHARLLLVEQGGLPNEEGHTILAPGLWTTAHLGPDHHPAAHASRALIEAFGQPTPRPYITLHTHPAPGSVPVADALRDHPDSLALLDPGVLTHATTDPHALAYRPGTLALNAAQTAIRAGAHLMLNTRAAPHPSGVVTAERLTVTNTHQIITHETHTLRARHVILATGADAPTQAEQLLGIHTRHARAYRQTPHLNAPSTSTSPTLHAAGLTLNPQHGAYTLHPATHHRDPHGYAPTGGHLTGVPTGLRRETLEDLVALMDALPVLATPGLHLGRSLSDIPGSWAALPHGDPHAPPIHEPLDPHTTLLLGGPHADTLGPHTAQELAQQLAQHLAGT